MMFYLGTDRLAWLDDPRLIDVPLFVSDRALQRRKSHRPAVTDWGLDSGGFTELSMFGEWRTPPHQYIARVRRYIDQIGRLVFASPQDWMCEPDMLRRTRLTISEHQHRTVRSVVTLRTYSPEAPIIPVLQGWHRDDYLRHVDMYDAAGFDLAAEPLVGIGSICRRQATAEAAEIAAALQPLRLHAFGAKRDALGMYGKHLASADSMAWSYAGRRRPDPTCLKRSCSHCLHYALEWRQKALAPTRPTLWGHV
jgi:hypothetical protein